MALTGLAVYIDKTEYSRWWDGDDIITVAIVPTPINLIQNETVLVELKRSWNSAVIWSQEVTFQAGSNVQPIMVMVDLKTVNETVGSVGVAPLVDQSLGGSPHPTAEVVSLLRTGYHEITVKQGNVTATSGRFFIGLITPTRFKRLYTFGLSMRAKSVMSVRQQPQNITGVAVLSVAEGSPTGFYTLTYNFTNQTLAWGNGTPQTIPNVPLSKMLLPNENISLFVEVSVMKASLPGVDRTDNLFVEEAQFSAETTADHLITAIQDVSDLLNIFVEPMRVATDPYWTEAITDGSKFKVPYDLKAFSPAWYPSSFRMEALAWHLDLPFRQLQWVQSITGFITNRLIVQLADNGITKINRTGFVDILPFDTRGMTTFWTFYGLYPYSLFARTHLSNFWRYCAIVGFNETPKSVIEMVAKKAAIDILTQISHAMTGGYESYAVSKDGVSQSVSALAIRQTIKEYQDWNNMMIPKLSQKYGGIKIIHI